MRVDGEIAVPGDKSITHRALMLAGLARGASELVKPLAAADTRSTARALRQVGVRVGPLGRGQRLRVLGSSWHAPRAALHCGNSGTSARLLLGLLAGAGLPARLTGDASLRRRPMARVTQPLEAMGAAFGPADGHLPITVRAGVKQGIDYVSPLASAQVKTALLFAGLAGGVPVSVTEPWRSRDHTERLFAALGLALDVDERRVAFAPGGPVRLEAFRLEVPGDLSSAAFPLAAALLAEGGQLTVRHVGVNPTRTGFLDVVRRMGGAITVLDERRAGEEPVADLMAVPSRLRGTVVSADEVPRLLDEIPLLAALASRAGGETVFRSVGELRVKESNRLELMAANLRAVGGGADVRGDDLYVQGGEAPPVGRVDTGGDHRVAMAFAVLGTVPGAEVRLSEQRSPAVSYPGFFTMLRDIEA